MQEEKVDSYETIRENFLNLTLHTNACLIVQLFQPLVDSERTASMTTSMKDLVQVLEERDHINEDNIDLFNEILEYFQKKHLLSDSEELQCLKDDIQLHKKEFDCPSNSKCKICLLETPHDAIELNQISPSAPPPPSPDFKFQFHQNCEIYAVIRYISENIGKDWRKFASILRIQERKISDIHKKYGEQNTSGAAYEALTEWMNHSRHISDGEKKEKLIKHLQRKNIYHLHLCSGPDDRFIPKLVDHTLH